MPALAVDADPGKYDASSGPERSQSDLLESPKSLLNGRITILRPYINIAAHLPSGSARTKGTYVLCMKPSRLSSSLNIIEGIIIKSLVDLLRK